MIQVHYYLENLGKMSSRYVNAALSFVGYLQKVSQHFEPIPCAMLWSIHYLYSITQLLYTSDSYRDRHFTVHQSLSNDLLCRILFPTSQIPTLFIASRLLPNTIVSMLFYCGPALLTHLPLIPDLHLHGSIGDLDYAEC